MIKFESQINKKIYSATIYKLLHGAYINFFCALYFLFLFFFLLYNTVLVFPYIDMSPPWVYMSFQS